MRKKSKSETEKSSPYLDRKVRGYKSYLILLALSKQDMTSAELFKHIKDNKIGFSAISSILHDLQLLNLVRIKPLSSYQIKECKKQFKLISKILNGSLPSSVLKEYSSTLTDYQITKAGREYLANHSFSYKLPLKSTVHCETKPTKGNYMNAIEDLPKLPNSKGAKSRKYPKCGRDKKFEIHQHSPHIFTMSF